MEGWIKLYRDIRNHWIWDTKVFSRFQAWIDMLMSANHADGKFAIGNELICVERGSFVTSELKLAERWGWSKTKVRAFLDVLEKDEMIVKKSDRKKTTITIVNYSVYQEMKTTEEPQKDCEETTKEPQKNTNKNEKNVKNEKKVLKDIVRFTPPDIEMVREYCIERNNNVDPQAFIDFYSSKGWMIGKNKMKDWKASVRTWERNNNKQTAQSRKPDKVSEVDTW